MLRRDAFCAPVLRRLPQVPGHQRRVVGRTVGCHGQQQVSGGAPVVVVVTGDRGHDRVTGPAWLAVGDSYRGAKGEARVDARVGRKPQ